MYDSEFYSRTSDQGTRAGVVLLGLLDELSENPKTAIDVGGGAGGWLAALAERGVDCHLVDCLGPDVQRMLPPRVSYHEHNLELPPNWTAPKRCDLVICVEVLEHLTEAAAEGVIDEMVRRSDTIVFSAAWRGQGGEYHINEQPLDYWTGEWVRRGYRVFDILRSRLGRSGLPSYYATNVFIASRDPRVSEAVFAMDGAVYVSDMGILDVRTTRQRAVGAIVRPLPAPVVSIIARAKRRQSRGLFGA